ncbi:MAG: ATP-dependent Clp protease proteolytic subunit [Gammaproteobacteria bacterium]|jgi:ATP-dependent Clp protease protease subunit|nr:ATP-dependent Clp protease proteolytic subunit [Gammaproteobacteria bacterium]
MYTDFEPALLREKDSEEKQGKISEAVAKALFDSRTILYFGAMNEKMSRDLTAQLWAMAHMSSDPIKLIINSPGGHVESGDTIHDLITFLKPEIKVIGTGYVASIASHIYLAAKLKNRFCLPNTRFLLHQPSGGMGGPAVDIDIQAREIIKMKKRINGIIARETGQPVERVARDTERDYWMSAEEAIEYGMVGRVIHSIDEI